MTEEGLTKLASDKVDMMLARVKEAILNTDKIGDIDNSTRIILEVSAILITPMLTYPGQKMMNSSRKPITPAEAADIVGERFKFLLGQSVKQHTQAMEKGDVPGSVEEIQKMQAEDHS